MLTMNEVKAMEWLHTHKKLSISAALTICAVLLCLLIVLYPQKNSPSDLAAAPPIELTTSTQAQPLSYSPVLSWSKDTNAVYYEVEFFAGIPDELSDTEDSDAAIYRTTQVFQNHYNPPLEEFASAYLGKQPLYWRVRAMDFNGAPYTPFSGLAELWTSASVTPMQAPIPLTNYNESNGSVLLYPVYHFIPQSGAVHYEIGLYSENPQGKGDGIEPETVLYTDTAELYDQQPRMNDTGYYWRVRSLDSDYDAISPWSDPAYFRTSPEDDWQVAVLGDSISHGGGHYSYGPEDVEFSWLHYLDFPTLNLSESGDTAEMTRDRFDRDVLPFHPAYLLIMTGSNSLRAGDDPEAVIDCLKTIQQKCRDNDIKPILLTLPPINPENIDHVFQEPTIPDWRQRFQKVNDYIRTQVHIDVEQAMPTKDGVLPTQYALDGLHPDVNGKQIMGEAVNAGWEAAKEAADEAFEEQEHE